MSKYLNPVKQQWSPCGPCHLTQCSFYYTFFLFYIIFYWFFSKIILHTNHRFPSPCSVPLFLSHPPPPPLALFRWDLPWESTKHSTTSWGSTKLFPSASRLNKASHCSQLIHQGQIPALPPEAPKQTKPHNYHPDAKGPGHKCSSFPSNKHCALHFNQYLEISIV